MNCPKCQSTNPESAKFCLNCGEPLVAAPASAPVADDEFELAPEAPKRPDDQVSPGLAGRIDLDAEDTDLRPHGAPAKKDKKAEKPKPEKPKDYKSEAQIFIGVTAGILVVSICLCMHEWLGLPAVVGLVFGIIAMLDAMKVDECYNAEDYEGAVKASLDAQKWMKIGAMVAGAVLVLNVGGKIALYVFNKLRNVVTPKDM